MACEHISTANSNADLRDRAREEESARDREGEEETHMEGFGLFEEIVDYPEPYDLQNERPPASASGGVNMQHAHRLYPTRYDLKWY